MLQTSVDIYKKTGFKPYILNIGGGLPVPHYIDIAASQYMPSNIYMMLKGDLTIEHIAKSICGELKPGTRGQVHCPSYFCFPKGQ